MISLFCTTLTLSFLDRYNFQILSRVYRVIATSPTIDRITGKISDQSLLFQYTIKLVLIVSFSELILYRLVSRLGMHLSKLAQEHEWIIPTFTALTEIGQWLLNVVAILLFLALGVAAINRMAGRGFVGSNMIVIPGVALLLLLTVGFLLIPPAFLGSAIYNLVALVVLVCLMVEYLSTHTEWSHRAMGITYLLGIGGWLYYQIVSTIYSFIGTVAAPPLVYEAHRVGEGATGLVEHPGHVGLWTWRLISDAESAATPARHLVLGDLRVHVYAVAVLGLSAQSV